MYKVLCWREHGKSEQMKGFKDSGIAGAERGRGRE